MGTVRDLITSSLKLCGVARKSEAPAADELADGLDRLNGLIGSLSNDALLCYARTWEAFLLTAGVGHYTIGTGGAFDTGRPISIVSAYTRLNDGDFDPLDFDPDDFSTTGSNVDHPIQIINDDDYALGVQLKNLTLPWPEFLNYDNAYPLATIRLWPVPSQSAFLCIQSEKQITAFAGLSTVISLPPGWDHMLRFNLAWLLAPEYGVPPNPVIQAEAVKSLRLLKAAILPKRVITYTPSRVPVGYDILSDTGRTT